MSLSTILRSIPASRGATHRRRWKSSSLTCPPPRGDTRITSWCNSRWDSLFGTSFRGAEHRRASRIDAEAMEASRHVWPSKHRPNRPPMLLDHGSFPVGSSDRSACTSDSYGGGKKQGLCPGLPATRRYRHLTPDGFPAFLGRTTTRKLSKPRACRRIRRVPRLVVMLPTRDDQSRPLTIASCAGSLRVGMQQERPHRPR